MELNTTIMIPIGAHGTLYDITIPIGAHGTVYDNHDPNSRTWHFILQSRSQYAHMELYTTNTIP